MNKPPVSLFVCLSVCLPCARLAFDPPPPPPPSTWPGVVWYGMVSMYGMAWYGGISTYHLLYVRTASTPSNFLLLAVSRLIIVVTTSSPFHPFFLFFLLLLSSAKPSPSPLNNILHPCSGPPPPLRRSPISISHFE
ncbi:hypothetical protein F5B22DRAFT_595988 [Xylaria bambusicola]|uniref:uncharacterized protein n=1 Tax=Xylaria bambusicola TaxID=326684 RepID=UPI00200843CE|nr:uncharacterized protein F5B22DRAFT_595988 [Xylaria bambusicola]KAI0521721.1 hypothetical protein F5B22DRAFT_595988 [Xylaria bambusicola]